MVASSEYMDDAKNRSTFDKFKDLKGDCFSLAKTFVPLVIKAMRGVEHCPDFPKAEDTKVKISPTGTDVLLFVGNNTGKFMNALPKPEFMKQNADALANTLACMDKEQMTQAVDKAQDFVMGVLDKVHQRDFDGFKQDVKGFFKDFKNAIKEGKGFDFIKDTINKGLEKVNDFLKPSEEPKMDEGKSNTMSNTPRHPQPQPQPESEQGQQLKYGR